MRSRRGRWAFGADTGAQGSGFDEIVCHRRRKCSSTPMLTVPNRATWGRSRGSPQGVTESQGGMKKPIQTEGLGVSLALCHGALALPVQCKLWGLNGSVPG